MSELTFDRDAFLELLTEAVRAGPGSPAWHDAVRTLREAGARADLDEYHLLLRAREHLESAKGWRSVRAGPQFTRDLLEALDREPTARDPRRWTTFLSMAAIVTIVAGIVGLFLLLRGGDEPAPDVGNPLASVLFTCTLAETGFDTPPDADRWQTIGSLPLRFDRGLRVAGGGENVGGGLVLSDAVAAAQPVAIEAVLRLRKPTDDVVPQLLVASSDGFIPATAASSRELAVLVQGSSVKLALPGGELLPLVKLESTHPPELRLRLAIDSDSAMVDVDGRRAWIGPHGLGDTAPRRVGVRFLQARPVSDPASFTHFRVLTP